MRVAMDHIVLNAADVELMMNFYGRVLNLPAERLQAFHEGEAPFPSVRINEETIIDVFPKKLWMKAGGEQKGFSNLNHFCLVLCRADWESLRARLAGEAIALEEGPVNRWGARGTGVSIYFRDPENNLIEARYYEAGADSQPCMLGS